MEEGTGSDGTWDDFSDFSDDTSQFEKSRGAETIYGTDLGNDFEVISSRSSDRREGGGRGGEGGGGREGLVMRDDSPAPRSSRRGQGDVDELGGKAFLPRETKSAAAGAPPGGFAPSAPGRTSGRGTGGGRANTASDWGTSISGYGGGGGRSRDDLYGDRNQTPMSPSENARIGGASNSIDWGDNAVRGGGGSRRHNRDRGRGGGRAAAAGGVEGGRVRDGAQLRMKRRDERERAEQERRAEFFANINRDDGDEEGGGSGGAPSPPSSAASSSEYSTVRTQDQTPLDVDESSGGGSGGGDPIFGDYFLKDPFSAPAPSTQQQKSGASGNRSGGSYGSGSGDSGGGGDTGGGGGYGTEKWAETASAGGWDDQPSPPRASGVERQGREDLGGMTGGGGRGQAGRGGRERDDRHGRGRGRQQNQQQRRGGGRDEFDQYGETSGDRGWDSNRWEATGSTAWLKGTDEPGQGGGGKRGSAPSWKVSFAHVVKYSSELEGESRARSLILFRMAASVLLLCSFIFAC